MSQPSVTAHLEAAPAKPLRFTVDGQQLVPNDFHVTEIKKVSIESLDCGGGASAWEELVIQLWSPRGDDAPEPMTVEKFSSILAKADALPLLDGEHVRFEFAPLGQPAVQYTLSGLIATGEALEVELTPPYAACKPIERGQMSELSVIGESTRCAPSTSSAKACCA